MTTVSGAGCCTSMLPPPVWVNPWRTGTPCPWRPPSSMATAGAGSAARSAAAAASGTRIIANRFMTGELLFSPANDRVHCRREQTALALEGARVGVVVVANLRPEDDRPDRLEVQAQRQGGVQPREARAVAVDVVEKLQPRRDA